VGRDVQFAFPSFHHFCFSGIAGEKTLNSGGNFNYVEEWKNLKPRTAVVLLILHKSKIPCSSVYLKKYLSFIFIFANANK